jgi:hypothetical protein
MSNDFSAAEARAHTDRMKALLQDIEQIRAFFAEAYRRRAWVALGYESWAAYVSEEFDNIRLVRPDPIPRMVYAGGSL